MSLSDYLEGKLLNLMFGNVAYSPPATGYMALTSGNPGEVGTGATEPVGMSYARAAVNNNKTNWSTALTGSGLLINHTDINFARLTGDVGYIAYVSIWDAVSAGNMLAYGALDVPRTFYNGDTPVFPSGTIRITMD